MPKGADSCSADICSLAPSSLLVLLVMSNSDSAAQGLVDRVQSFISENKRAIIIGTAAAAIAAGGVAYYASSSKPSRPDGKKDKKKSSKKRKTDGPIIEEVSKPADAEDPGELSQPGVAYRCLNCGGLC